MLIDLAQATLLVVDIQEKLVPAVLNSEAHVQRVGWLLDVARDMDLPVVFS